MSVVCTLEIEEKGVTEEEMVAWHHRFSGRESEQTLGDGEEQGSAAASGVTKSQTDTTE